MTKEAAELLKKALSLPVSERADLAGSIIESLDETHDPRLQPPGTKKSLAAWPTSIPAKSSPSPSRKLAAVSLRVCNESVTLALVGHFERNRPTLFLSRSLPANVSACAERNLSSPRSLLLCSVFSSFGFPYMCYDMYRPVHTTCALNGTNERTSAIAQNIA